MGFVDAWTHHDSTAMRIDFGHGIGLEMETELALCCIKEATRMVAQRALGANIKRKGGQEDNNNNKDNEEHEGPSKDNRIGGWLVRPRCPATVPTRR